MNILLDYLVMSMKYNAISEIITYLNIDSSSLIPIKSFYGYEQCLYYDGIKIHSRIVDGEITETCLDLSGKGCRTVEYLNNNKFDWFEFLNSYDDYIHDKTVHISRIDIACDDTEGVTQLRTVRRYTHEQHYICRAKTYLIQEGNKENSIYFGDSSSDRRLRIYDKSLEQKLSEDVTWLRYEFQLRNDNAISFYLNWCKCRDIGKLYAGVMIDFLRFVEVPRGKSIDDYKNNENRSRLSTSSWWDKFLNNAVRIPQMYLPGREYTFLSLEKYLQTQTNSSVKTYLLASGGDLGNYIDQVNNTPLNAKQKKLLRDLNIDES